LASAFSIVAASAWRLSPITRRRIGRVGDLARVAAGGCAGHERFGFPRAACGADCVGEGFQFVVVREIDAHRILPLFTIEDRPAAGCAGAAWRECTRRFGRIGDEVADRNVFVDDAVDERGVRAVFEQAAHEIRQQVFMRSDRRVVAARHVHVVGPITSA
jgi:hypothetical protein